MWCCVCGVVGNLAPVRWCACLGVLYRVHGVLGHSTPVPRCARSLAGLCVRRPWPLGFCSPVCTLCVRCCGCGVLGHLGPVHRCACSLCCFVCAVSWATWLLFSCVHALCAVLRVWCPGPSGPFFLVCSCGVCCVVLRVWCPGTLGSCSPVCSVCVLRCVAVCVVSIAATLAFVVFCCLCVVLGLLAPVHRCARLVCGVASVVSWASPAPVHRWARPVCGVAWAVSLAAGLLLPVCSLGVRCCVCGVLGHLAPVHRCACSVCAVSWASWLLFTGARVLCAVLCVLGVLGLLAPAPRCACAVCCAVCAVSWTTWLLFTAVLVWRVVWCARCPGTCGFCSPVCTLDVRCFVHSVLGLLAPVHRCAFVVCCAVCAVSWANWLLFTAVLVWRVVWCVWCPGPRGSCSPVCTLGVRCFLLGVVGLFGSCSPVCLCCVLCGLCGVLAHLGPVHRCARVACVVLRVPCPGPRGSCSPVCCVFVRCVVCCLWCAGPCGSCSPVCMLGWCVVCVVWVWVCVRVCHTIVVLFLVAPKSRRCRCNPLGLLCAFMTYAIWSLRCGLFVFSDPQEQACLNACMAAYAIYSLVCGLFVLRDAQE